MERRFYIIGEVSENFYCVQVFSGYENNYEKHSSYSGDKFSCELFLQTGDYKQLFWKEFENGKNKGNF